jgi:hypothetical protein
MNPELDPFGSQLREAAQREAVAFSQQLHERVMAGVRETRMPRIARPKTMIGWWPVALAAAAVIALVVWLCMPEPAQKTQPGRAAPAVARMPQIPPLGKIVQEVAAPVGKQLYDARFAYLDRDGESLANFLLQSVPRMHKDASQ